MLTGLLLLPVAAILVWLYWYLLPARKWLFCDSLVLMFLMIVTGGFVIWIDSKSFVGESPLWPYVLSATGTYIILAIGLGLALAWRRSAVKLEARK